MYAQRMRATIDIDEILVRKARKLTGLKTTRQVVDKALELLVRSESGKGILRYYGSGIWAGSPRTTGRDRADKGLVLTRNEKRLRKFRT